MRADWHIHSHARTRTHTQWTNQGVRANPPKTLLVTPMWITTLPLKKLKNTIITVQVVFVLERKKKLKSINFATVMLLIFQIIKQKHVFFYKGFLCVSFGVIFRITSFIFYPMEFIKKNIMLKFSFFNESSMLFNENFCDLPFP